jgi:hypothetical protein
LIEGRLASGDPEARSSLDARRTPAAERDWPAVAVLVVAWIAAVLLVDPRGDFPMLDDWSFGRSVKTLLEEGTVRFDGWNTPTLIFQVLYGALFSLPFGFSFEALRVATLVAGLACGLGTYWLLRTAAAGRYAATIGAMVVLFNPSFFQHSFTFMTDVPFAALSVLSGVLFLRALRGGASRNLVLGTVLSVCATLVRDVGVAIPLAYAVAALLGTRISVRSLVRTLWPVTLTGTALLCYRILIDHFGLTPALQGAISNSIVTRLETAGAGRLLWGVFQLVEALVAHFALFAFPLLLVLLAAHLAIPRLSARQKVLLLAVLPLYAWFLYWRFWPPALPIRTFGLMDPVAHGVRAWGPMTEPPLFRAAVWGVEFLAVALTLPVALSAARSLWVEAQDSRIVDTRSLLFGLAATLGLVSPFLLGGMFMERYLIPCIAFIALALVSAMRDVSSVPVASTGKMAGFSGAILLGLYAAVSIGFAHDSLLWNRLRWDAVRYLLQERGFAPSAVDGGLTVNGWYLFPDDQALRQRYVTWRTQPVGWWRNLDARFVIVMSASTGGSPEGASGKSTSADACAVVWQKAFRGWLPGNAGTVRVCELARA